MLLTITLILFVVASIGGAVTAHLDHTRLRALDRAQNTGPIPSSIIQRESDRGPLHGDRELEAYGRA